MRYCAPLVSALIIGACHAGAPQPGAQPQVASSRFLFVWAGDADRRESDFLAVIDVDPGSAAYASVVATLPVGAAGTRPHHTEHEMPAGGVLWANGFDSGRTFRLDLRDPTRPRLSGSFGDAGPFGHPHSYARLPNGNVLATFQRLADDGPPARFGWTRPSPRPARRGPAWTSGVSSGRMVQRDGRYRTERCSADPDEGGGGEQACRSR